MSSRYGFQEPTVTNTRPEQIIDKNGVLTTRHKKMESTAHGTRISGAPSPALAAPARPLAAYTPAEVDVPLAEIYFKQSGVNGQIRRIEYYIGDYERIISDTIKQHNTQYAKLTEEGNTERAEHWADPENSYEVKRHKASIEELEAKLPPLYDALAELRDEASVYEEEFDARGGWSRFFQVTNSNGHVHKSTRCSTCYPTTEFYWHADRSGSTDEKIVDESGSDACTVCFPDAPVETLSRPGTLETPDRTAQREAREERERVKEEKARVAAEKSITSPSGEPVLDDYNHPFKTELAAERAALGARNNLYWYGPSHPSAPTWERVISDVTAALAHKRGTTVEEMEKTQDGKAIAKLKKDGYTPESIKAIRNERGRE